MPTPATTERTRIQLCGSLSIEIDGVARAQALRGRQVPLLLAYMVLSRDRAIGREELSGALWPDSAPRSQDAALRTLLSRLRSALGADIVDGRDEVQLRLPEPAWVDVEAAAAQTERAQAALERDDARAAWALAQVPLNIATRGLLPWASAHWLEPFRRDLEDVRLRALELIGRAGLALGNRAQLPSVQRAARTLIDAEPYRESGYVLLMEAHAAEGNQAQALRVFERLRTLLRDELGTAPSPEALAVHARLLRAGVTEAPAADSMEVDAILALPAELRVRAEEPLVARDPELGLLQEAWRGITGPVSAGERLLLLTGDAGIGKSRLVAELAARVHADGAAVLAGRCPAEALLPYQPFVEALRHYVLSTPLVQLRAVAREYGAELGRLLPELRRRVPELPVPPAGDSDTERYRLFEAVVGLLAEIASRRPLLLVIDDLQWADRPTMLLLRHTIRARDLGSVMVLGAVRAAEAPGAGFADVLGELRREGLARSIELRGLPREGVAELVRARAGAVPPAPLVRALHARTEGNPFFIEELLRQLADAGVEIDRAGQAALTRIALPRGIKEQIAQRLGRLDGRAAEWLRAAAVIGRDFEVALLEDVLGQDEEEFLSALEASLAAGLVVQPPAAGMLSFSHALIREAVYEEMSLQRRARMHRRVGEALAARSGEPPLAALAFHFTRAAGGEDAVRAIDYARAAGAEATAMLAHEEAAEHFARALEVQERFMPDDAALRGELLLSLGEARVRAGDRPAAWATFREAATIAGARGDAQGLARAAIAAARRYIQPPGFVDTDLIALLEQALELTREDRTVTRVALLTRMCGALYYTQAIERMQALAAEATEIARELGIAEAQALAAAARRRAHWGPEHLRQRLNDATELLTYGQAAGDLELALQGHAWLVLDLLEHGEPEAVDVQIEAFQAGAERLRQPLYLWNAAVWRAMRALLAGRLDEAERLAAEALALGAAGETIAAQQYYATQLLAIRREQMRMAELEAPARQLMAANPERIAWRAAVVALLAETGREEEAGAELETLRAAGFGAIPRDGDWLTTVTLLADAAADLGDTRAAAELLELLGPHGSANVVIGLAAVCLGSTARLLGRLAATTGQRALAVGHFERALVAEGALGASLWLAHTQVEYSRLLGPEDPRARELAGAAVATAERLGLEKVRRRGRPLVG